jgi:hypothetical protein
MEDLVGRMRSMLLLLALATPASSASLLSNVFGSNMVLQHGRPAPIWGWAAPAAKVTVTFGGKSLPATAGADGLWKVVLPPQAPSLAAHTIGVSSGPVTTILVANVLFGEVILCSGQSNMEFVLSSAINATAEIAAADGYPHIRVVDGPQQNSDRLPLAKPDNASVPHNELFYQRMNWSVASSETVGKGSDHCCRRRSLSDTDIVEEHELSAGSGSGFSAVCWFAARDLFDSLGGSTPVGAIDQSYGGTSIQFWMSERAIAESRAPVATQCCGQNGGPSCLWNTQIFPYTVGPMQFKGVLWYQGEQNANCGGPTQTAGSVYSTMLQTMVTDWRVQFKQPGLLFGSCLLAPWKKTADEVSFAELRLAQANLAIGDTGIYLTRHTPLLHICSDLLISHSFAAPQRRAKKGRCRHPRQRLGEPHGARGGNFYDLDAGWGQPGERSGAFAVQAGGGQAGGPGPDGQCFRRRTQPAVLATELCLCHTGGGGGDGYQARRDSASQAGGDGAVRRPARRQCERELPQSDRSSGLRGLCRAGQRLRVAQGGRQPQGQFAAALPDRRQLERERWGGGGHRDKSECHFRRGEKSY